jgi:hypothetical protein
MHLLYDWSQKIPTPFCSLTLPIITPLQTLSAATKTAQIAPSIQQQRILKVAASYLDFFAEGIKQKKDSDRIMWETINLSITLRFIQDHIESPFGRSFETKECRDIQPICSEC